MNDIYEGRLAVNTKIRQANLLVSLVVEELRIIPPTLLGFCFQGGLKIYLTVPDDRLFFIKHGLGLDFFDEETGDGRNYSATPHVLYGYRHNQTKETSIILIEGENSFIRGGHPHSIVIHEFAHAADYILGCHPLYWHDSDHISLLSKSLPDGESLDWYAAENVKEKFAVAFEAFCHPERFYSKNGDYRTHNKLELFTRSPEIFKFFEQFFENWQYAV